MVSSSIWICCIFLFIDFFIVFHVNGYSTQVKFSKTSKSNFYTSSNKKKHTLNKNRFLQDSLQNFNNINKQQDQSSSSIEDNQPKVQQLQRKCGDNNGTSLNLKTRKCFNCSMLNCLSCHQKYCLLCNIGFNLKNNRCIKQNCSYPCQTCQFVNKNQICNECIDGYYLNISLKCSRCDQSCNTCSNNSKNCTKCLQGYFPHQQNSFVCQKCLQDCFQCNNKTICNTCEPGYQLSFIKKRCFRCNYPCADCVEPSIFEYESKICYKCHYPYNIIPNQHGICYQCNIKNCKDCQNNIQTCNQCWQQFKLENNKCLNICQPQCAQCNNNMCNLCIGGYALVNTQLEQNYLQSNKNCQKCSDNHCQVCSYKDKNFCQLCKIGGYATRQGICKPCDHICQQCLQNICFKTRSISEISGTAIYRQRAIPCPNGCVQCKIINELGILKPYCFSTEDGFYSFEGEVNQCRDNCIQCFFVNEYICVQCIPGYVLQQISQNCIKCIQDSCDYCDSYHTQQCYSCHPSYYLQQYTCYPCNISQCRQCNQGKCIVCQQGYVEAIDGSGHCVECLSSCLICSKTNLSLCFSCGKGYFLDNNICYPCLQGCISCKNNITCSTCFSGYLTTYDSICTPICKFPCFTCIQGKNNQNNCVSCIIGYQLVQNNQNKGECRKILKCNETCKFCPLGYSIVENQCIQCSVNNCASCNIGSPECISCFPGYYITMNTKHCCKCNEACQTCKSQKICYTCSPGYVHKYLRNQPYYLGRTVGQCIKCNFPCNTCIGYAYKCSSCVQGYVFHGWKCILTGYIKYLIVLDAKISEFYTNYRLFNNKIIQFAGSNFLKQKTNNPITSLDFSQGSVRIIQKISIPDALTTSQIALQLKSKLIPQDTIINRSIIEFKIIQIQNANVSSVGISSSNQGIYFMIGIPVLFGIVIIAIIILILRRKKYFPQTAMIVRVDCVITTTNKEEYQQKQNKHGYKISNNIDQFYL